MEACVELGVSSGAARLERWRPAGKVVMTGWRSRGYLGHLDAGGVTHHVVFCLADAFPPRTVLPEDIAERRTLADRLLDEHHGRRLLDNPVAAEIVEGALLHFDGERYRVFAWCVMPNHVHVLVHIQNCGDLPKVVHSWKSFSAHAINKALGRSGSLWQREYFDRYIRDDAHYFATLKYIEGNPVAAGLVDDAREWGFSSARLR